MKITREQINNVGKELSSEIHNEIGSQWYEMGFAHCLELIWPAVETLNRINIKVPHKVSREEAADMACEFKIAAAHVLDQIAKDIADDDKAEDIGGVMSTEQKPIEVELGIGPNGQFYEPKFSRADFPIKPVLFIEKSAYKKAVEALRIIRYRMATIEGAEDIANDTLRELGEL